MIRFTELFTKRLHLRKMIKEDAKDLFAIRSDPKMLEFTDGKVDETLDDTIYYITRMNQGIDENRWLIWAMIDKQSNKVVGTISLWNFNGKQTEAEFGYGTGTAYQHQGFMKEALIAIIEFGFQTLKLVHIHAYTEQDNFPSNTLLQQMGFTLVGSIEEEGYINKRIYHMNHYKI